MSTRSFTLDLGCGKNPVSDADVKLDLHDVGPADMLGTLSVGDDCRFLPFQDDVASDVYLNHTLEHLENINHVMAELCRITEPGGTLHIKVPYFNSLNAAADPTHTAIAHQMTEHFFEYYDDNVLAYETGDIDVTVEDITLVYRKRGLLQRLFPTALKRMVRHEIGNMVEEMHVELTVGE